ncbi:MFS transporter [Streptacidiphilus sp. P02-A3a]|uniref:MFS transporter n=1 Tax=Streptacidiphilus sp. P02-A3a TaxID=2704468 RepID=UPI001CDBD164|nr:MFS transporter [Streptacidiphilus sp. P02-A3a]
MSVLQPTETPRTPPVSGPRITALPELARRGTPVWAAAGTALLLGLLWAVTIAKVTGDLAAQWAWADFAALHPGSAYDLGWYGGMYPASYSVLAPYLMGLLGVRTVAVTAATVSAALLAVLVLRSRVRRPLPVALWGAFALSCDVAAGRVTFALGLMFGLASVVVAGTERATGWRRTGGTAALALLATMASPVAGLFVEVAAAALLFTGRRRTGIALAVPPPLLILVTTLLFPFAGVDPITVPTVVFSGGCAVGVALLLPAHWRALRVGAVVYALGIVLTWSFRTPIGGNVQRLALLFGGVAVLAALCAGQLRSRRRAVALLVAFAATAYWTVTANVIGIPAPSAPGQADGLVAELKLLHADQDRIEAVPMQNHWESWGLVGSAELARGWNRQLDVQRNPLFYNGTLTPASYHAWLRQWAVGYVALPDAALDVAGRREAALVRTDPSWLRQVWHDGDWTLYRVTDAVPLATAPAVVERADADQVLLAVPAAGQVTVRVSWSPWLTVRGPGGACLARDGAWTRLDAPAPGVYRISADYGWPRGAPC